MLCTILIVLENVLTGVSSLQRWAAQIEMRRGILHQVLEIMKLRPGDKLSKLTVISFDEMKVKECLEYDSHHDEVIGPYKKVQIGMARGLCSKWKQPIFVEFDTVMTSDILRNIISELYKVGYTVVACVSDSAAENCGLWNKLGVSMEHPYFPHPCSTEKIVCFPDVPHLLKLFRNWLLDTGFVLPDGSIVTRSSLYKLLDVIKTEINVSFKLKETHLTVQRNQRQNVRMVAELVSHTTACALKRYDIDEKLGNLIQLVNDWFDLMNTRTPEKNNVSGSPYGFSDFLDEQNQLLEKVGTFMKEMRCVGKSQTTLQVSCLLFPNQMRMQGRDKGSIFHHKTPKITKNHIMLEICTFFC